jgi:hypothetical protein
MTKLNFLTFLLSLFVIVGCSSETDEQQVEALSTEDAYKFLAQYLETNDDGLYELKISAAEAEKNHVSAEDYAEALSQMISVNKFIQEQESKGIKRGSSVDKSNADSPLLTRAEGEIVASFTIESSRDLYFSSGSYRHLLATAGSTQFAWGVTLSTNGQTEYLHGTLYSTDSADFYGGPDWHVVATKAVDSSNSLYVTFTTAEGCMYYGVYYPEGARIDFYTKPDGTVVYGYVVNGTIVVMNND